MSRPDGSIVIDTKILDAGFKKGMAGLKSLATGAGIAIGAGITAGAVALTAFSVASVKAAESDKVADARIRQIAESMSLFGDEAGAVTTRLTELATAQALATGVDDAVIKATQAKLLTFKDLAATADEVGGSFDRATTAAIDLAAAGFGDAESNAVQLGKALQDPIKGLTALARSGVTFTAVEKDQIKAMVEAGDTLGAQNAILKAIEAQVGGTAAATATTTDRMKVAFGELQEAAGGPLLAVFDALGPKLLSGIQGLTPAIEQTFGGLAKLLSGDLTGGADFAAGFGSIATSLAGALTTILPGLVSALATVIVSLAQAVPTILPVLIGAVVAGLSSIAAALPQIIPALMAGFLTALQGIIAAIPVILPALIEGFAALILGLATMLPDIIETLIPALGDGIALIATKLGEMAPILLPAVISIIVALVTAIVQQVPKLVVAAGKLVWGLVKGIIAAVPVLIKGIGTLLAALWTALGDIGKTALEWGGNLVRGIWNGISNIKDWLLEKVKGWVGTVTNAVKAFFGISSPSKLFEKEVGVNLALGIGSGFGKTIGGVAAQMAASVNAEMGRFGGTVFGTPALAMAGAGGSSQQIINFNRAPRTYSEVVRAMSDIEKGLVG